MEKMSFKSCASGVALVMLVVGGAACRGRQPGDGLTIAVGTTICKEIRIVKAAGIGADDRLTIIDGKGDPVMPLLPRELATIQAVLVSPAKDMALVVSVGEGHPWINVYRIVDWFAPAAFTAEGVQPYRTMDPYPFSWSDIAWRSRAEVAFRSVGDYGRFDPATRRPGGAFDGPDRAWIWDVAADTVRAADAQAPFADAFRAGPPYVGVSYYPEVAGDQLGEDVRHMVKLGINMARFGDFAWSTMEPAEGRYDFAWMHRAVDAFAAAKIAVVLCTPTAAPPAWLSAAHPEILRINANGLQVGHGGRRQYCPNSPVYRGYARGIAARLGDEFGRDGAVVAWQIDNEFWEECYCDNCLKAFRRWLKDRYGTVDDLNALWLTALWSQTFSSFDQVPLPNPSRVGGQHHPSLRRAYREFMNDSYLSFCMEQVRELRNRTAAAITTNGHNPRYQRMDFAELFRDLDVVEFDSYADPEQMLRYAFEADWMRALGGKPFWLAETASTWAAGTTAGGGTDFGNLHGALRAKMWLNYALGADAVSFWLWRVHWAGQELEHGSLLYPWGDETPTTPEIRQVAWELKENGAWLSSTRPAPRTVAMHYGVPMQWQFEATRIADGFDYDTAISAFHAMLARAGVERDVIAPGAPVDGYRVVLSPYLPYLSPETASRMRRFVEAGGTWVLGPLSACRTADATAHRDAAYGADLERWLGVHVRHRMPAHPSVKFAAGGALLESKWWCDAFEPQPGRKTLARYAGGALDGLAAAVECPVGRGRVILLGTQPPEEWWRRLFRDLAGPDAHAATPGVEVCARVDRLGKAAGVIAVNTTGAAGSFVLEGKRRELAPYGVFLAPSAERR